MISHRGEGAVGLAVDGQAGCILRAYREHQMSADAGVPQANSGRRIKLAMQCLIRMDATATASSKAPSTTRSISRGSARSPGSARSTWPRCGPARRWPSEVGDAGVRPADREICRARQPRTSIANCSTASITTRFPTRTTSHERRLARRLRDRPGFGQSWAFQVGLGRILPEAHVKKALAVALEIQLHARRRPVPQGPQARAAGTPWRARPA